MGAKEYELPSGRKAVFEFDENGVGKITITIEAMDMLMELINIDLVRCGECKWWDYSTSGCERIHPLAPFRDDDFCSYGEPRESEYVAKD